MDRYDFRHLPHRLQSLERETFNAMANIEEILSQHSTSSPVTRTRNIRQSIQPGTAATLDLSFDDLRISRQTASSVQTQSSKPIQVMSNISQPALSTNVVFSLTSTNPVMTTIAPVNSVPIRMQQYIASTTGNIPGILNANSTGSFDANVINNFGANGINNFGISGSVGINQNQSANFDRRPVVPQMISQPSSHHATIGFRPSHPMEMSKPLSDSWVGSIHGMSKPPGVGVVESVYHEMLSKPSFRLIENVSSSSGIMSKLSVGWYENMPAVTTDFGGARPKILDHGVSAAMYAKEEPTYHVNPMEQKPVIPQTNRQILDMTPGRELYGNNQMFNHHLNPTDQSDAQRAPVGFGNQQVQTPTQTRYAYDTGYHNGTWNCSTEQGGNRYGPSSATERFPVQQPQVMYQATQSSGKTPTFNGRDNFDDFIIQFDCLAMMNKWSQELKGQKLLLALVGQATSILGTMPEGQRMNYDALKLALQKRFQPKLDSDIAGTLCQSRRKKHSESYLCFAQDLKRLINAAHPDWPEDCIEGIAREKFFSSLSDSQMKGLIWSKGPTSLEEAAEMADNLAKLVDPIEELETAYVRSAYRERPKNKHGNHRKDNSPRERRNDSNQNGHHARQKDKQVEPSGRSDSRQQNGESSRGDRNTRIQGNNQDRSNVLCYACNEIGHYANVCPTKRKGKGRNDQNQPENC